MMTRICGEIGLPVILSGVKITQLSYFSKSKDTVIENDSSKSETHPVKSHLSKCLKEFGFKYT